MNRGQAESPRLGVVSRRWPRLEGVSAAMRHLEDAVGRVAEFQCPVLVTGETGCGKEEVARAIHAAGPRKDQPFFPINCGGLIASIAEAQLFGHQKGSFTGADGAARGGFRAADGGVLFLDEIGEMPVELQPKLLRVLQRGEVLPVGSTDVHHVDVQVIAATNRDLDAAVAAGAFREDLFYRLNTVHLEVPPLRQRREDIPRFIRHFAAHFAVEYQVPVWQPSPEVFQRLLAYAWPGNVRQLAQTIQRMYIFADRIDQVLDDLFESDSTAGSAGPVEPRPVPPADGRSSSVGSSPVGSSGVEMTAGDASFMPSVVVEPEPELPLFNLDALRRLAVRQAIARTDGHRGRAAELLGVSLNTMTRLVAECCPGNVAKVGRKRVNKPR